MYVLVVSVPVKCKAFMYSRCCPLTPDNGAIPGPTLRVKAGDTLTIMLENKLSHEDNAKRQENLIKTPNTTNVRM